MTSSADRSMASVSGVWALIWRSIVALRSPSLSSSGGVPADDRSGSGNRQSEEVGDQRAIALRAPVVVRRPLLPDHPGFVDHERLGIAGDLVDRRHRIATDRRHVAKYVEREAVSIRE